MHTMQSMLANSMKQSECITTIFIPFLFSFLEAVEKKPQTVMCDDDDVDWTHSIVYFFFFFLLKFYSGQNVLE